MTGKLRRSWFAALLFLALFLGSITPIRSYDYFWHLATGRWIADHRALPRIDPFAIASDPIPWTNGEWAFQLFLFGIYSVIGHAGMSFLRAAIVAGLFTGAFVFGSRRGDPVLVALVTLVGWIGADHRLSMRPETIATCFALVAVALLIRELTWPAVLGYAGLTILWINVHPSGLLSPVLVALSAIPLLRQPRQLGKHAVLFAAAAGALLVNPYGPRGVLAPLELMRTIGERRFVNLEWLPSSPRQFPLVYVVLAAGLILFMAHRKRMQYAGSFILFAFFGYLAVRHLRNQGFFFATAPLLLAPFLALNVRTPVRRILGVAAVSVWAFAVATRFPIRLGVDDRLFPVESVARLRRMNLAGNIYNPDQFGGFLIWTFYPERRVLTDGRNELFRTFLGEYEKARTNNRAWQSLIEKYNLTIAVDEYREPVEVVDAVSRQRRTIPASQVYFPPIRWALVGFDGVGMVFVRRDAVPAGVLAGVEIRGVVPESMKDF